MSRSDDGFFVDAVILGSIFLILLWLAGIAVTYVILTQVYREEIAPDAPIPTTPFWGARVIEKIPLKGALAYINEIMLFQVQWQYKKKGRPQDEAFTDRLVRTLLHAPGSPNVAERIAYVLK